MLLDAAADRAGSTIPPVLGCAARRRGSPMTSYDKYVKDENFLAFYNDYQKRYADRIAERDKVMLGLIAEKVHGKGALLDIGCSTGNLLLHIKRAFPEMNLTGGELAESSLTAARANPDLAGIEFRTMDMLDIPGQYDCITANAVTYLFDWPQYERAIRSIARVLRSGGTFISFDWYHRHSGQSYAITEFTPGHPEGLTIHTRPYDQVSRLLTEAGLAGVEFRPFFIPIDLPEQEDQSSDPITYTKEMSDGNRLCFRGSLHQPWCYLMATKL
jgi:SAM-dependent methyltransferase